MKFRVILTTRVQVFDDDHEPPTLEEVGVDRGFFVSSEELDANAEPIVLYHAMQEEVRKAVAQLPAIIADDREAFAGAVLDALINPVAWMMKGKFR